MLISPANNVETIPANDAQTPEAVNKDDDGSTVIIEALQDPLLVLIYKGLPELPYAIFVLDLPFPWIYFFFSRLCEVEPFGKTTNETVRTPFAETCEELKADKVR
jgi:hypothetical protein